MVYIPLRTFGRFTKYKESVFMIIEARELSKIYGSGESRVVALDKADLKIGQGDFLSITGPSGSGKSTLLHLLSGLDRPTSGLLSYGGRDIYSFHDKELSAFRRRRIGFIFQQFNLLPVLTARENIIMPLLLDKKQPDEAYLRKLTELLGIQKRLNHLPHELSGGQQQRVAIARADYLIPAKIHDAGKIKPAFIRWNIGNVTYHFLSWPVGSKIPVQDIFRHWKVML